MTAPRRTLAAAVVSVAMLFAMALPAAAITGGQPDGNRHPNVGLILFYDATGRFRCSATLVSPTVLITAAHCTEGTLGSTLVTFDSVIAAAATQPIPGRGRSQCRLHPRGDHRRGIPVGHRLHPPGLLGVH